MNKRYVGDGKVVLIAGGGKTFTDIAARFVGSEKSLEEIITSPYDKNIVENIINSNHGAATEFDYFVFGVEGYARVTEIQLVRKRLASYLIKSGRKNKKGKRSFDVVLPKDVQNFSVQVPISTANISISLSDGGSKKLSEFIPHSTANILLNSDSILDIIERWYDEGVTLGFAEEDLRYLKPQATEFKAIIGMNAHALLDWFKIRTCKNAQTEIRDLALKMMKLSKESAPDLMKDAGPSCKNLGYCPENRLQHKDCRGKIYTKDEALNILAHYKAIDCKEQ